MAKSPAKTWTVEVLTHTDLNAEFLNIYNSPMDLISPATAALDMNGMELVMDADSDSSLTMDTDDTLHLKLGGADIYTFTPTALTLASGSLLTADGGITVPTGKDITLTDAPSAGTDGVNKTYCDLKLVAANDLSDVADAGTARTNLGLGTAAVVDTGTSGTKVALTDGVNTWSGAQTMTGLLTANGGITIPTTKDLVLTDAPGSGTDAANKDYVDTTSTAVIATMEAATHTWAAVQTFSAAPVISSFASATHDHADAAGGGALAADTVGTSELKLSDQSTGLNVTSMDSAQEFTFATTGIVLGGITVQRSNTGVGDITINFFEASNSTSELQGMKVVVEAGTGGASPATVTVRWKTLGTV